MFKLLPISMALCSSAVLFTPAGAMAKAVIVTRPGIMCRDARALAILTRPGGDSRTHTGKPTEADLNVIHRGGCVDLQLGSTIDVEQEFLNTAITLDDRHYVVPRIDLSDVDGSSPAPAQVAEGVGQNTRARVLSSNPQSDASRAPPQPNPVLWFWWFKEAPFCHPDLRPDQLEFELVQKFHVAPVLDDHKDSKTGRVIFTEVSYPEHGKTSSIFIFRYQPDCEIFSTDMRKRQAAVDSRYDPVQQWWQFNEVVQTCENSHMDPPNWRERVRVIYGREPILEDGNVNPETGRVNQLTLLEIDQYGTPHHELLFRIQNTCEAHAAALRRDKPTDRYK